MLSLSIDSILDQIYALSALRAVTKANAPIDRQQPVLDSDRRPALSPLVISRASAEAASLGASMSVDSSSIFINLPQTLPGESLALARAVERAIAFGVLAEVLHATDAPSAAYYQAMAGEASLQSRRIAASAAPLAQITPHWY